MASLAACSSMLRSLRDLPWAPSVCGRRELGGLAGYLHGVSCATGAVRRQYLPWSGWGVLPDQVTHFVMSKLPEVATVALDNLRQTAWFARLQVAITPLQAAALVIELVDASGLAVDALLCWSTEPDATAAPTSVAGGACSAAEKRLVRNALAAADGTAHAQGLVAVRLQEAGQVVLLCRLLEEVSVPALLEALGSRLSLALARLSCAVHRSAVPPAQ